MNEIEDPPRLTETPDAPFALRSLLEQAYAETPQPSEIELLVQAVERRTSLVSRPATLIGRPMLIKFVVGIVGIGAGLWLWAGRHAAPHDLSHSVRATATAPLAFDSTASLAVETEPMAGAHPAQLEGRVGGGSEARPHQNAGPHEHESGSALVGDRQLAAQSAGDLSSIRLPEPNQHLAAGTPNDERAAAALAEVIPSTIEPRGRRTAAGGKTGRGGAAAGAAMVPSSRAPSPSGHTHSAASTGSTTGDDGSVVPDVEEYKLLRAARGALTSEPARAIALTEEHKRKYTSGMLSQEREAIAIEALERLGRRSEASTRLQRFVRQFPNSPYRGRLEALVSRGARDTTAVP